MSSVCAALPAARSSPFTLRLLPVIKLSALSYMLRQIAVVIPLTDPALRNRIFGGGFLEQFKDALHFRLIESIENSVFTQGTGQKPAQPLKYFPVYAVVRFRFNAVSKPGAHGLIILILHRELQKQPHRVIGRTQLLQRSEIFPFQLIVPGPEQQPSRRCGRIPGGDARF